MKLSSPARRTTFFVSSLALSLGLTLVAGPAAAKVVGSCGNCHTMHNSQDNAPMAHTGEGVGWNAEGVISGGTVQDTPNATLLIADCVGCHSSTTDATIIDFGSNKVPIVFNTGAYPTKPLAGGNFYQVAQGEAYDGYGHNVYGISDIDTNLTQAPGNTRCSGPAGSCHNTLAVAPGGDNYQRGGCQGCHYQVYHHVDNEQYRFLNSHDLPNAYVEGNEHAYWEHADYADANNHNMYKGVDKEASSTSSVLKTTHSISAYCGGCHNEFHSNDGTGTSVWLRHPTDITLPEEGEYAQYNPVTDYSLEAPVAWINPGTPVRSEAIVMCLSCHRVHGSQYPDILRWDYDEMIAAEAADEYKDTGCFVCHRTKDD